MHSSNCIVFGIGCDLVDPLRLVLGLVRYLARLSALEQGRKRMIQEKQFISDFSWTEYAPSHRILRVLHVAIRHRVAATHYPLVRTAMPCIIVD